MACHSSQSPTRAEKGDVLEVSWGQGYGEKMHHAEAGPYIYSKSTCSKVRPYITRILLRMAVVPEVESVRSSRSS
jgi:hypothetical protein